LQTGGVCAKIRIDITYMEHESQEPYPRVPLGDKPKNVRISSEEMHLAYLNRLRTGEPMQTYVRRLIRESGEAKRA
jgi:hypothetical protein